MRRILICLVVALIMVTMSAAAAPIPAMAKGDHTCQGGHNTCSGGSSNCGGLLNCTVGGGGNTCQLLSCLKI